MKKQLKEIKKIEKKVSKVCDTKKTVEVTRNDDGIIINKEIITIITIWVYNNFHFTSIA
jgi:hypothetical protein